MNKQKPSNYSSVNWEDEEEPKSPKWSLQGECKRDRYVTKQFSQDGEDGTCKIPNAI